MRSRAFTIVATLSLLIAVVAPGFAEEPKATEELKALEASGSEAELFKGLDGLSVGALWYLSFQAGDVGGADFSKTTVKRGYINIVKQVIRWGDTVLEARITPDVHQDELGDFKVRLKYAYGKFKWNGPSWQPWLEFGLVHGPWFDFEEHINLYRMQDTMFIERNGTINSADVGVTVGGFFGSKLEGAGHYPGRYGSFMVGVYNGGGYHAKEVNTNKAVEARITVRPLPEAARGLQFSYFGVKGKGNTADGPDWSVNDFMVSFEHQRVNLTAQYYRGEGNQKGKELDGNGQSLSREGYSVFGELKLPTRQKLSLIGRYDYFDFDTDTSDDEKERYIAGFAWDLGNHNTILFDFDRLVPRGDGPDTNRFQVTLQIHY